MKLQVIIDMLIGKKMKIVMNKCYVHIIVYVMKILIIVGLEEMEEKYIITKKKNQKNY
jgi:hypothetical protein